MDDCNGFENRRSESYRGFESLPFRSFLLFSSCKALQVVFSSECGLASFIKALLVELVDTLVLGTSAFSVRVRVPRRAKFIKYTKSIVLDSIPFLRFFRLRYSNVSSSLHSFLFRELGYRFDKYVSVRLSYIYKNRIHGASPSGKAAGFDPAIRRFESFCPSF